MSLPDRTPLLHEWAGVRHPVIGMLHLPPLPGAPGYRGEDGLSAMLRDAEALVDGGCDGLMLENFGDAPFYPERVPAITIAAMTRIATAVLTHFPRPLGINVLRNDGLSALAIAAAVGARFIRVNVLCGARVTDQGVIQGIAHDLLRERRALNAESVKIFADVDVKHSAPLGRRPLVEETHDLAQRGGADAIVVSGPATGKATSLTDLPEVAAASGNLPVFVGSGATLEILPRLLSVCHGLIVGTGFKRDGQVHAPVDAERVRAFVATCRNDR